MRMQVVVAMDGADYEGHWKEDGTCLPHWLTSTEMATGSTRLTLSALALMVVQRQSAASRSATPDSSGQQVSLALAPTTACTTPLSASTHATSFNTSTGHLPVGDDGVGVAGVGGVGAGEYGGGGHGTDDGGGVAFGGGGGGGVAGVGQLGHADDGAASTESSATSTSGAMRAMVPG